MRLHRIVARGLHRRDVDLRLTTPVTLLVGANEAGKTSVLDSIRLALDGPRGRSWPVFGTKPSEDWGVCLDFDDRGEAMRACRYQRGGEPRMEINGMSVAHKAGCAQLVKRLGTAYRLRPLDFYALSPRRAIEAVGGWFEASPVVSVEAATAMVVGALGENSWQQLVGEEGNPFRPPGDDTTTGLAILNQAIAALEVATKATGAQLRALGVPATRPPVPEDLPPGTVATWRSRVGELSRELCLLHAELGRAEAPDTTESARASVQEALSVAALAGDGVRVAVLSDCLEVLGVEIPSAAIDTIHLRIEAVTLELEETRDKADTLVDHDALVTLDEHMRVEHAVQTERLTALRAAGKTLWASRSVVLADVLGELLEPHLAAWLAPVLDATPMGEWGSGFVPTFDREDHQTPFASARSTSIVGGLGLQLAAAHAHPWRAVIADDLDVLDPTRLHDTLAAAAALAAEERLDNFISAAVRPPHRVPSGVQVLTLGTT